MPVYQDAKLSTSPNHFHGNTVKRAGKCLKGTKDKGFILKPDLKRDLETHVDADFSGAYDKDAYEDPSADHSRTGFIVECDNCPMTWK